jgi:hypothetical protein
VIADTLGKNVCAELKVAPDEDAAQKLPFDGMFSHFADLLIQL